MTSPYNRSNMFKFLLCISLIGLVVGGIIGLALGMIIRNWQAGCLVGFGFYCYCVVKMFNKMGR